jgi:hypothetical protein
MIYKDKKQNLQAEWVTLIPNTEKKAAKFIGTLEIEQWNGKFKKAFAFEADGTISPVYLSESNIFKKINYNKSITCYTSTWYGQTCVSGYGCGEVYIISSETYCYGGWGGGNYQDEETDDSENGSGGGGGGDTNANDYIPDCNGDMGGSASINLDCNTCMGGNTGVTVCPPFLSRINSTKLKPCMQSILDSIKNLSNGSVAGIIQKFSGNSPGYNWVLKDGRLLPGKNAATPDRYKNGTVTTVFDSEKFIRSTDLSIAKTILHESVHAYLVALYREDNALATATYPDYVEKYAMDKANNNLLQHNVIVDNFVTDIGIALKEYGKMNGYDFSDQFYNDLAWGGLENTPSFNSKSASEKQRILDAIAIEQFGVDNNGMPQNQKGKDGGC